jgi:hypothetical protein
MRKLMVLLFSLALMSTPGFAQRHGGFRGGGHMGAARSFGPAARYSPSFGAYRGYSRGYYGGRGYRAPVYRGGYYGRRYYGGGYYGRGYYPRGYYGRSWYSGYRPFYFGYPYAWAFSFGFGYGPSYGWSYPGSWYYPAYNLYYYNWYQPNPYDPYAYSVSPSVIPSSPAPRASSNAYVGDGQWHRFDEAGQSN